MKRAILFLGILFFSKVFAQKQPDTQELMTVDNNAIEKQDVSNNKLANVKSMDSLLAETRRKNDSANLARFNEQNTKNIDQFIKERDATQKSNFRRKIIIFSIMLIATLSMLFIRRKKV